MDRRGDGICRLCLESTTNLRSLLEDCNLLSIAREIVRLDISVDDNFPKTICESCSTKLHAIEGYVKIFQESERKLRNAEIFKVEENSVISNSTDCEGMIICASSTDGNETPTHSCENQSDPIQEIPNHLVEEGQNVQRMTSKENSKVSPARRSQRVRVKRESLTSFSDSPPDDVEVNGDLDSDDDEKDEAFPQSKCLSSGSGPNNQPEKGSGTLKVRKARQLKSPKNQRNLQRSGKDDEKLKVRISSNIPTLHDFKCYICSSESLGTRKALIEHLATHVDKIPYTCEQCVMETVVLTRVRTLNTHMKMHEQPVKCDYCDRRYSNAAGKYYHTHTYHLGGGAPCLVNCELCGKQCGSKMALKQHMKYHTTSLKCSKCDMVFNHANKRRNHELTHENQGYECIVCKKVLQTIESYDVHLKKHSQERGYQCSLCPKKFNTSCNLILHLKVHAKNYNYRPARSWVEHYTILSRNPMKYKCNHCERYGTDKVNNMISHLQAHFKEHQCDRCMRLFATAKQLRAHYTTYTGEKSEMCQHCGKCFSTKNSLRIHLKTHSGNKVVTRKSDPSEQLVHISELPS